MKHMKLTIRGHSDDIIIVEGKIFEEFYPGSLNIEKGKPAYLAFGDGTVLSVYFNGEWNIKQKVVGKATFTKKDASGNEYSDVVTLEGEIGWVVFGSEFKGRG